MRQVTSIENRDKPKMALAQEHLQPSFLCRREWATKKGFQVLVLGRSNSVVSSEGNHPDSLLSRSAARRCISRQKRFGVSKSSLRCPKQVASP